MIDWARMPIGIQLDLETLDKEHENGVSLLTGSAQVFEFSLVSSRELDLFCVLFWNTD